MSLLGCAESRQQGKSGLKNQIDSQQIIKLFCWLLIFKAARLK